MKKMLSLISALTMCAVMAAPVVSSAAETELTTKSVTEQSTYNEDATDDEEQETQSKLVVSKGIDTSYTVIIPAGTADLSKQSTLDVSAENVTLTPEEELNISVTSINSWSLVNEKDDKVSIEYALKPTAKIVEDITKGKKTVTDEETNEEKEVDTNIFTKDDTASVLSESEQTFDAGNVLTIKKDEAFKKRITKTFTAEVEDTATMAGKYTDTLTFSVEVK